MKTTWVAVAVALAAGCSKSKQDKCEAGWKQMEQLATEMAKAFDEDGTAEKPGAEEKKQYMELCLKLPDDAVDCMTSLEKAMTDPTCEEVMERAEKEHRKQNPVTLEWEERSVADGAATARIPKGWKQDEFFGYQPPDDADLGFFTKIDVKTTCGGYCEPKPAEEWAKTFDEHVKMSLDVAPDSKVAKDEAIGEAGRLVVVTSKLGTEIIAGFWKAGAERYVLCNATVDDELEDKLGEFEQACREVKVTWPAAAADAGP